MVVGTRPGLNVHLARQAPRRLVRVAQEHLTLDTHSTRLVPALRRHYPALDAVTTTTEGDAAVYRRRMPGLRVLAVPNSVPPASTSPSDCSARVVVAAGRLTEAKRYDDLIRAFAIVRDASPDWLLRIYGGGDQREHLAALITDLDLGRHVALMGRAAPLVITARRRGPGGTIASLRLALLGLQHRGRCVLVAGSGRRLGLLRQGRPSPVRRADVTCPDTPG